MDRTRGIISIFSTIVLLISAMGCSTSSPKPDESPAVESSDSARKTEGDRTANGESSDDTKSKPAPQLPPASEFDASRAYVATIGTGTITALDLDENEVTWTLKVSEGTEEHKPESAMGIAASRDGSRVFTGDVATKELVVVDADQREIVKRIPLDHGIHAVDICPHGHWLWVAGRTNDYPWLSATTIVNAKTLEKVATVSSGLGHGAHFAFSPDGKRAWAASVSTNLVWYSKAETGEVLGAISTGEQRIPGQTPEAKMGLIGLNEVALTPDGSRAFAVGPESGTVYIIDVSSREVVDAVDVGERTHGVSVTRDGREAWTANNGGSVTVVDVETGDVLDQIEFSPEADSIYFAHIAFSVDGKTAYVSWAKNLSVIDVATHEVVKQIDTDAAPHEISLEDYYVRVDGRVTGGPVDDESANVAANEDAEGRSDASRTSKAAGIEVLATPRRADNGLSFQIEFNTHSGDLMGYDVVAGTTVVVDGQVVPKSQIAWEPDSESSHHRSGTLAVSAEVEKGAKVTLTVADLGVPERTLEWASVR